MLVLSSTAAAACAQLVALLRQLHAPQHQFLIAFDANVRVAADDDAAMLALRRAVRATANELAAAADAGAADFERGYYGTLAPRPTSNVFFARRATPVSAARSPTRHTQKDRNTHNRQVTRGGVWRTGRGGRLLASAVGL